MGDEPKVSESRKEAHKRVTRTRHQFLIQLAQKGHKKDEIIAISSMIDWAKEMEWVEEEIDAEKEAKAKAKAGASGIPGAPIPISPEKDLIPPSTGG